jgi:hypothetical protein
MSLSKINKYKPKYPQNIDGTHCMGNHWTVCCPNRHLQYQRYITTKEVIQVYYKGGIYRVFVCTVQCSRDIRHLAKTNPEKFKKLFIHGVKPNGDLILKHRDTGEVAQIAQKIDTYDEKSSSKKTKKQKGGFMNWFTHSRSRSRRRKHKKGCGHTMKHRKTYK